MADLNAPMVEDVDPTRGDQEESGLDERIDQLRSQIATIEKESERVRQEGGAAPAAAPVVSAEDSSMWAKKHEVDQRSVYVGQVDYQSTPDELAELFGTAGTVNRVTILCNKWTGHPKGYAYVEFEQAASVQDALKFNGHSFRERHLKVSAKRTNTPWWMQPGNTGSGGKGSGRGKGGYRGRYAGQSSYLRGRGGWWQTPYYTPYGGWWRGRGRGRGRGW
eukprot:TRINITY_DN859_c0_g2_i2.p1 TRINITY_DN859_c0_g2~~TRINITY_DN859_c0_g2_i2.p1  ORF type:complete len:247 (+),score=76.98 TRINITY_DN859_c0_g2_i2:82-741(+)